MSGLSQATYNLCGRTIAFSGVESAQKLKPLIEDEGGRIVTEIDVMTDILVYNSLSTYETRKLHDAKILGVPVIIDFNDFVRKYLGPEAYERFVGDASAYLCTAPLFHKPRMYNLPAEFKSLRLKKIKRHLGVVLRDGDCIKTSFGVYYVVTDRNSKRRYKVLEQATYPRVVPLTVTRGFRDAFAAYKDFDVDEICIDPSCESFIKRRGLVRAGTQFSYVRDKFDCGFVLCIDGHSYDLESVTPELVKLTYDVVGACNNSCANGTVAAAAKKKKGYGCVVM